MKQEELADRLQSRTVAGVCQRKLKSTLKEKFQCVFEGIAKAGNPTLLNQIYTELYIRGGVCRASPGRDAPIRAVLTKGVAGIGKTVLTQKFTLDWAEGKANQDIQFTFPFTFRELNVRSEGSSDPQKRGVLQEEIQRSGAGRHHHLPHQDLTSLHIMCHSPSLLLDLCFSSGGGVENQRGRRAAPRTLTEMYIHFLVVQSKVKNVKYHGGAETDPHWSPESRKMIKSLGKLAFEQLQKGSLERREDCTRDKVFCFVHLSVQEFLAALHVHLTFIKSGVNLLSEEPTTSRLLKLFRPKPELAHLYQSAVDQGLTESKWTPGFVPALLLGLSLQTNQKLLRGLLTETGSGSEINQETVQYIKKKMDEDLSAERSINLFHCLNELNDGEDLDVFDLKKYSASEEALLRLLPVVKASRKALYGEALSLIEEVETGSYDLKHPELIDPDSSHCLPSAPGACCSPVLEARSQEVFLHNKRETHISSSSSSFFSSLSSSFFSSDRVAVYLDHPAGSLSFYRVSSDTLTHLHTSRTTFTEPLYAGFGFGFPGSSSVSLCSLQE
ncbi:hypothetical protein JOQ06_005669 [Pogonophryne albipinna]|uniref:FISNA domain-containing protein n=1 Tax=Pogonophryne albipinna TaxID=1090488 RepID=A0AAD6FRW2_9TELE|nr:hypothetical protein JOQ06_005669 [Pogonophryne albipinna]